MIKKRKLKRENLKLMGLTYEPQTVGMQENLKIFQKNLKKRSLAIIPLESTIHPYSGTILKNIYNRESVAALSEFLATVQEITEIKFPIFIKSSKLGWWDSFVSVIHLYTQELIKNNPQDGQELPELPKKKKLLKNNYFIAQLKFIEKCLLIQQEIIADTVNNIPPLEEESINQTNNKVFKVTKV